MIDRNTIDKIFDAAIIEEVIGEFVQLKKSGSSFKGLSPFANEKTPSFFVVPHKQIFKDFSSGKGGNVVSFLMEHEKFSYPEALRWLADKYGIEIEEEQQTEEQLQQRTDRESLSIVSEFAQRYFTEQMNDTDEGKSVGLGYFRERGFSDNTIENFLLGYCPEGRDSFTKAALAKGYKLEYLIKAGLTKERDGVPYDFFRGRVMFPIRNISGKTIAFGARTLRKDKKTAKYFNSAESELYIKSNTLYGLYLAKKSIVQKDNCYIVEGYTDVISLNQSGVENVVASAGTSLTQQQIRRIKRYSPNITILFDGDRAGIQASFRGIDMILSAGMNVRIVLFPDGADPDSFARSVSTPELHEYLEKNAKDFIVFKTDLLLEDAQNDPIKKAGLVREIVASVALIPDAIKRELYTRECSKILEIEESTLITETNKILRKNLNKRSPSDTLPPPLPPPIESSVEKKADVVADNSSAEFQERDLVRLLFLHGDKIVPFKYEVPIAENKTMQTEIQMTVSEYLIEELRRDGLKLKNNSLAEIVEDYAQFLYNGEFPSSDFFIKKDKNNISEIYVDLTMTQYELSENWTKKHRIYPNVEEGKLRQAVESCIYRYKTHVVLIMLKDVMDKIKIAEDQENDKKLKKLMKKKLKLDQAKKSYSEFFGTAIISG